MPGCKGEIIPSREIRSTVARAGACSVCGARYKSFGGGDWKFETERVPCLKEGCDGDLELEIIPGQPSAASCWKCETAHVRQPNGAVSIS